MGVVYLAQDPRLKRQVAIKLLPPDLTRDETAKQRFLQEAQAASALDHPNICTIFEINETADGQLYLVMAHYGGETLKEPDHSCSVHAPLLRQRFPGVSDCGLGNAGFVSTPLGEPDGVSIEGSSL